MCFWRSLLFTFAFISLLFSCNKQEVEDPNIDFGYEYYPLELGKFREFEADSIIYDPTSGGTEVLLSKTFVREEITDTLLDNSGNTLYVMSRFERPTQDTAWEIARTISLSLNETQAIRNEDNLRFIEMVFPLDEGQDWDGNQFFDPSLIISIAGESIEMYKSWAYETRSIGQSFTEAGLNFDDVVEVSMADSENLIELRMARQVFARNIGLVFRELLILDTQCQVCCNLDNVLCDSLPWEQKAERGFILRQKLINHN